MKFLQAIPLYQGLLTLLLLILKRKSNKKLHPVRVIKGRKRTCWSREWLLRRDQGLGLQNLILNELKLEDPTSFKNCTRMSTSSFDFLLQLVRSRIQKQDTILRQSIPAETR